MSQIVGRVFAEALQSRRYKSSEGTGGYQVSGVIRKLECNQIMSREAKAEIEVVVTHMLSGKSVFNRTYSATNYESAGLSSGVFASPEDLRALTERTLQEVINKALDDSAFQNSLRS